MSDAIDMDRLLDQDALEFYPVSGQYDVEALAVGLANIAHGFRDEARPERFVLSPDPGARDAARDARRADPASPFPMLVNVETRPDLVMVWPATFTPGLRDLSQEVLAWLLADRPCVVENDMGLRLGTSAG